MKVLVAEDDPISRRLVRDSLVKWGYEVTVANNGNKAWEILRQGKTPQLVLLDWMMPGMDGVEVCKRVRAKKDCPYIYIILLTAKGRKEDVVGGFDAGADDYVTKPFNARELHARVKVGERVVNLEQSLANNIKKLKQALAQVKQLHGLLPICVYCKRIRDDKNYWQQVEKYVAEHSEVQFSHSVCPECYAKYVKPQLKKMKKQKIHLEVPELAK